MFDVIVIGGGPAGLSAALDAAYLGMRCLLLEAGLLGGSLANSYPWKKVDSMLGFPGMNGSEIAKAMSNHIKGEKIDFREHEAVTGIERTSDAFLVKTLAAPYSSRTVILATGVLGVPMRLSVPGEDIFGVFHAPESPETYKGKQVLVVGGGDTAADTALSLIGAGAHVILVHRRDTLRAMEGKREALEKAGAKFFLNSSVKEFCRAKDGILAVIADGESGRKEVRCHAAFVLIGSRPASDVFSGLGIETEGPLIKTDADSMTSVKGVFAAGDIACSLKRIPQAMASGERAAFGCYKYLKNPYWKNKQPL